MSRQLYRQSAEGFMPKPRSPASFQRRYKITPMAPLLGAQCMHGAEDASTKKRLIAMNSIRSEISTVININFMINLKLIIIIKKKFTSSEPTVHIPLPLCCNGKYIAWGPTMIYSLPLDLFSFTQIYVLCYNLSLYYTQSHHSIKTTNHISYPFLKKVLCNCINIGNLIFQNINIFFYFIGARFIYWGFEL